MNLDEFNIIKTHSVPFLAICKEYMCTKLREAQKSHLHSCNLIRRLGDLLLISDETMRYIFRINHVVHLSTTPCHKK